MTKDLAQQQNVSIFKPIKKKKGQQALQMTDRAYPEEPSRVRQPIESFFN